MVTEPRDRHYGRRQADISWSLERKLLVATFLVTVFGWGAGGGVYIGMIRENTRRTEILERTMERLPAAMAETYMRRDVYQSDQRRLTDAIDRLNATLGELGADPARIEQRMRAIEKRREQQGIER